jgi:hypothetical protein
MTHCPRCQAPLPDPPDRFCPSCGADLGIVSSDMPATAPYQPSDWTPAAGRRQGTPWERREEIGFLAALVETTQAVLTSPAAFFRAMPTTGGIGGPLLYAILIGYAGIVVSSLYEFVLTSVTGSTMGSLGAGNEAMQRVLPYLQGAVGLGVKLVLGPVFLVAGLFITSGLVHAALLMLGGAKAGFEATFRVACYAEAAAVLNILPICGGALAAVYTIVLMIIGISQTHGISRGRAAAAVLLPLLLCCCCLLVPIVGFVMSLASQVSQ